VREHHLEPAARRLADAAAQPPFPYELGPAGVRTRLDDAQATAVARPAVDERWAVVPTDVGDVRVRIVTPPGAPAPLPAVLYLHGGGWVAGSAATHDRLVRELAVGAGAAVVFVEFDRAPEARYPVALEQAYAVARWVVGAGSDEGVDGTRLAVAGDSTGGTLAAALTLLAKRRGDVAFVHQSLYSPVTDAAQDTDSYWEFADGPYLTARAMAWCWDAYLPERAARYDVTMSPLRATLDDLAGLPEAFVVSSENDPVRDEAEAYARRLGAAGVRTTSVRFNGTIHDFLVLDALRGTAAATAALDQAVHVLRKALGTPR
jgi:acetyl esterase